MQTLKLKDTAAEYKVQCSRKSCKSERCMLRPPPLAQWAARFAPFWTASLHTWWVRQSSKADSHSAYLRYAHVEASLSFAVALACTPNALGILRCCHPVPHVMGKDHCDHLSV